MKPVRFRRARCLVAFWEDGEFVIENFLTKKQTTIAPLVAQLLQEMDEYLPESAVLEHFRAIPFAQELIAQLVTQDVLVIEKSLLAIKDSSVNETWKWKNNARYFHYSTQDVPYEPDIQTQHADLIH